jgi:hypothetical protein
MGSTPPPVNSLPKMVVPDRWLEGEEEMPKRPLGLVV